MTGPKGRAVRLLRADTARWPGVQETYEDKHYYKGTVEGDTIEFTMVTDSSIQSHTPIHFTANRVKNK
jgi:hypothetical protein